MVEVGWLTVFIAASITALATGLGALPFLFIKDIGHRVLALSNALAAGLMLGASIGLLYEGATIGIPRTVVGAVLGLALIYITRKVLEGHDDLHIGKLEGVDALTVLTILVVMTVHSFAEGVGVGVSWGGDEALGELITIAIAIHNIPEGLAISLIVIPRGASVLRAAGYSVFSSLPQPIMAVPAFLFVIAFRPFLPVGLGLAAGAMVWMVFTELLPDALEDGTPAQVYPITAVAVVAMIGFQILLGA